MSIANSTAESFFHFAGVRSEKIISSDFHDQGGDLCPFVEDSQLKIPEPSDITTCASGCTVQSL